MDQASQHVAEEMDACEYLYLRLIETVKGYGLRIIVDEIVPQIRYAENPERDFTPELAVQIRAQISRQKVPDAKCFEISFRECISYTVVNETYSRFPEAPEKFTGKLFRSFAWSYLLELTKKTTYASDDHPGPEPMKHYQIVCQDDVVDVIACIAPEVRLCQPDDGKKVESKRFE